MGRWEWDCGLGIRTEMMSAGLMKVFAFEPVSTFWRNTGFLDDP